MKVIAKFAGIFFVVSCVLLLAFGYTNARRESRELEAAVAQDLRAYGEGLRSGVETTWASRGQDGALAIIRAEQGARDDVELDWIATGDAAAPATPPLTGWKRVSVIIPVRDGAGSTVGSLSLWRDVPSDVSAFEGALADEMLFAVLLALAAGLLAVSLGGSLIGRPLQRVVDQAERIGRGDFTQRLPSGTRDEIGDLKRALNTMCDQLELARTRIEEESTARIATLEQLRRLDRLRTVGTLSAGIAHELGTPLNVVLMRAQALSAGTVETGELSAAARTIISQVEKMTRIVRQLLDFSRARPSERRGVEVGQVAKGAVDLLQSLAKKQGVECEVVLASREARVLGDEGQLEQAITNLVVNALQAMPEGGRLTVTVRTAEKTAVPDSSREIDAVFVDVADEGPGIAAETLARIFEPFYTTKPEGQGTGLGLVVAQGIAADHEGWIAAESVIGRGSKFSLVLPRRAAAT